jgi:hypothetical protein
MALTVVDHPLAGTMLTALRDASTPPPLFRLLAKRLSLVLAVEATRGVPTASRPVTTPLAETQGTAFAAPLVAVPILRAGLGMLEAVTELFPEVPVGYLGLERDHATFQPSTYYSKLPDIGGSYVLLLDPMLATGGSAAAACAGPGHAAVGGGRPRGHPAPGGRAPVAGRGHRGGGRAPQRPGVHRPRAGRFRGPAVRDMIEYDSMSRT